MFRPTFWQLHSREEQYVAHQIKIQTDILKTFVTDVRLVHNTKTIQKTTNFIKFEDC